MASLPPAPLSCILTANLGVFVAVMLNSHIPEKTKLTLKKVCQTLHSKLSCFFQLGNNGLLPKESPDSKENDFESLDGYATDLFTV